jgi:ATP-dependent Clp protease, protease subunit
MLANTNSVRPEHDMATSVTVDGGSGISDRPVFISFTGAVNQVTTPALIGTIEHQISTGRDHIHLMLSTSGGVVNHGIEVYNVLRARNVAITTYNMGTVESIGNVLFLAGTKRYAVPSSRFMFHGVSINIAQAAVLEAKNLKQLSDTLRNDEERIASVAMRHTKMSSSQIRRFFRQAAYIPAQKAVELGIVHEVIDVTIPQGALYIPLIFQH